MEEIIEHYGMGLLQILGGIGAMTFLMSLFQQDGLLQQIVFRYLQGICG